MKTIKKILASLLVVVMVLTAAPLSGFVGLELPDFDFGIRASAKTVASSGSCGPNVTYTYNSTTGELVISGEGPMTDYGSYSSSPFYYSDIKRVVIDDGVTVVGSYAFQYCTSLTSVTIPGSVTTIYSSSFNGCNSLSELTISMKEIPSGIFSKLNTLKKVTLTESVEIINDEAFADCPYLETINFPDSLKHMGKDILKNTAWFNYKGKGLIIYDNWAYGIKGSETGITVILPANVKGVAERAFTGNSNIVAFDVDEDNPYFSSKDGVLFNKDKSILVVYPVGNSNSMYEMPNTVMEICIDAFENNRFSDIYIEDFESWCKIDFANSSSNPFCYSNSNLYINGELVSAVVIPDTITEIKAYSFWNCSKITSVKISNNVTMIGASAFNNCHSLTRVTLGDSLTAIDSSAFSSCDSITRVTIPDGVTTIGYGAFRKCDRLKSVTLGKEIHSISNCAFQYCNDIKDVYYPGSQEDWEKVSVGNNNEYLTDADLYLMHTHEYIAKEIKQASCTSDGEILYTCKLGDAETEIIPSLGHNWVDMGGSVKATCTTDGVDNYKCSNCGEEKKGTIPAFGHDWEYIEHTYATCNKDGYMSRVCLREGCGVKEEKVTPASHNLDWWDTKEPTCTEPGAKYIGCLDCSYSFAEAIPANGHTYYWKTIKNATCTTEGLKEKCCEWCSDTFETETIPVEGHTYSEWVELLPATCSERGLNIKICNDCNDIQRQIIPKIAHIDADGNGVCDNCDTDTPEEPDAPEEPDTPEVPDTPDNPDEPEEEPCDCDCHAGGIKAFFFNFLNFFAKLFNKDARTCECGAAH